MLFRSARGGAFCGFSLYVKDGRAGFGIRRLEGTAAITADSGEALGDAWVHLAGVVHEDTIELFVDGRLAARKATDGFIPSDCGQGMQIGGDISTSPVDFTEPFHGAIDEVKVFHAALDADRIVYQSRRHGVVSP